MDTSFYNTSYIKYIPIEELDGEEVIFVDIFNYYDTSVKVDDLIIGEGLEITPTVQTRQIKVKHLEELKHRLEGTNISIQVAYGVWRVVNSKDGEMFKGWRGDVVRKSVEELGPEWVKVYNYKKRGYVNTKGVKSAYYKESPITQESFKDDFLVLNYKEEYIGKEKEIFDEMSFEDGIEYFYGADIYEIAKGIKEFSGIEVPLKLMEEKLKRIKEAT